MLLSKSARSLKKLLHIRPAIDEPHKLKYFQFSKSTLGSYLVTVILTTSIIFPQNLCHIQTALYYADAFLPFDQEMFIQPALFV